MTKTFCDLCRKQMPDGIVATKLRIDNLLHDFCDDCWTRFKTLLEGTGTSVVEVYMPYPGQVVLNAPSLDPNGQYIPMNGYNVVFNAAGGNSQGDMNFVGNVVTAQKTFMENGEQNTMLTLCQMET
jgi:hypothetical protein